MRRARKRTSPSTIRPAEVSRASTSERVSTLKSYFRLNKFKSKAKESPFSCEENIYNSDNQVVLKILKCRFQVRTFKGFFF